MKDLTTLDEDGYGRITQVHDRLLTYGVPMEELLRLSTTVSDPTCKTQIGENSWIVRCKTCCKTELALLCVDCFKRGPHMALGHDYIIYKSNDLAVCDCGDKDYIDKDGCCDKHSPENRLFNPCATLPVSIEQPLRLFIRMMLCCIASAVTKGDDLSQPPITYLTDHLHNMAGASYTAAFIIGEEIVGHLLDTANSPLPYTTINPKALYPTAVVTPSTPLIPLILQTTLGAAISSLTTILYTVAPFRLSFSSAILEEYIKLDHSNPVALDDSRLCLCMTAFSFQASFAFTNHPDPSRNLIHQVFQRIRSFLKETNNGVSTHYRQHNNFGHFTCNLTLDQDDNPYSLADMLRYYIQVIELRVSSDQSLEERYRTVQLLLTGNKPKKYVIEIHPQENTGDLTNLALTTKDGKALPELWKEYDPYYPFQLIKSITDNLRSFDATLDRYIQTHDNAALSDQSNESHKARGLAHQKAIREKILQQQKNFSDLNGANDTSDEHLCVICHEPSQPDKPLAAICKFDYLFLRRFMYKTNLGELIQTRPDYETEIPTHSSVYEIPKEREFLFTLLFTTFIIPVSIRTCKHLIHQSCRDSYSTEKMFICPMCNCFGEALLPIEFSSPSKARSALQQSFFQTYIDAAFKSQNGLFELDYIIVPVVFSNIESLEIRSRPSRFLNDADEPSFSVFNESEFQSQLTSIRMIYHAIKHTVSQRTKDLANDYLQHYSWFDPVVTSLFHLVTRDENIGDTSLDLVSGVNITLVQYSNTNYLQKQMRLTSVRNCLESLPPTLKIGSKIRGMVRLIKPKPIELIQLPSNFLDFFFEMDSLKPSHGCESINKAKCLLCSEVVCLDQECRGQLVNHAVGCLLPVSIYLALKVSTLTSSIMLPLDQHKTSCFQSLHIVNSL
eukprot:gene17749-21169_t